MNAFAGTGRMIRLALRRDRFTAPVWVLGLAGFLAATTALWADQLSTVADLIQEMRVTAASPGISPSSQTRWRPVGGPGRRRRRRGSTTWEEARKWS